VSSTSLATDVIFNFFFLTMSFSDEVKFAFGVLFNIAMLMLFALGLGLYNNENDEYDDVTQQRGLILIIISPVLLGLYNFFVFRHHFSPA